MYGYLVCGDLGWYCTVGYTWVSCGNVFFYVCQSWSYAEHFFSDICCWSCMILWLCGLSGLCVLLLIYPSVLVWYRWGGGTFNLCAVSVLSEWVNVVQLHTDLKNSPIRYNGLGTSFLILILRTVCAILIKEWKNKSKRNTSFPYRYRSNNTDFPRYRQSGDFFMHKNSSRIRSR